MDNRAAIMHPVPLCDQSGEDPAVSSFDGDAMEAPSDIAALVSTPDGLMLLFGAAPRADEGRRRIVMTSIPLKGADETVAFAQLYPGEGETGPIVAMAEKRRNRDFYVSIARATRGGENGQPITLNALRSWEIPGLREHHRPRGARREKR